MLGFALALPIALTALGLAIATMFRTIEFERVGTFLGAVAGLTIAGWAISSLLSFVLLPDNPGSRIDSDWSRYAVIYGASLAINVVALGVTSLVIDGVKIRGFLGLLAAAVVVTAVENVIVLTQLARIAF